MQIPVEIVWHEVETLPHVEKCVNERVARLEKFFDRIIGCRVVVESAHRRHRKGNEYEVRVEVTVPGGLLAIDRKPGNDYAHQDLLVAVRDAFDAMERKLQRWKDEHSGRPELGESPLLQGKIAELHAERDGGQIAVTDGRLIYFHRNAEVDGGFEAMEVGQTVELTIAPEDQATNLRASLVRRTGPQAFVDKPR